MITNYSIQIQKRRHGFKFQKEEIEKYIISHWNSLHENLDRIKIIDENLKIIESFTIFGPYHKDKNEMKILIYVFGDDYFIQKTKDYGIFLFIWRKPVTNEDIEILKSLWALEIF